MTTQSRSVVVKSQFKTFSKTIRYDGHPATITIEVRYDDQCGNGHNSFSITGSIRFPKLCSYDSVVCGCIHKEIAKHMPELAKYIKWHLFDSHQPMHYVANTVYLAGNLDHWGLAKGEFRQHTSRGPRQADGVKGIPHWEIKFPDGFERSVYSAEKPASTAPYSSFQAGATSWNAIARNTAFTNPQPSND